MTENSSICRQSPSIGSFLKLAASLTVVLLGCSIAWESWPLAGALLAVTLAALAFAGLPLGTLLRRMCLFLPIIFLVAFSIPLSQGFTATWIEVAAAVVLRGTVSFLAGLWLIRVLPFDQLLPLSCYLTSSVPLSCYLTSCVPLSCHLTSQLHPP